MTKTRSRFNFIAERCKGCRFCIEFCTQHVLYQSDRTNSKGYHIVGMADSHKCDRCNTCSMVCPEFAIHIDAVEETVEAKEGAAWQAKDS